MFKAVFLVLALAGCCEPGEDACTAAQNAALGGVIAGGGYHPYRPAPAFVTCAAGAQGTVSCIGQ
jgi:hypothetical protein